MLPQEPSDSPVTPWLCRTEPLLRHKSSKVRPRKPHPKGDGQGGAAFLKPAHPRRGPGEPQSRARLQPRLRARPRALRDPLPVKPPNPDRAGAGGTKGREPGLSAGLDRQLQPQHFPSPEQGERRGRAAPGQPKHRAAPSSGIPSRIPPGSQRAFLWQENQPPAVLVWKQQSHPGEEEEPQRVSVKPTHSSEQTPQSPPGCSPRGT